MDRQRQQHHAGIGAGAHQQRPSEQGAHRIGLALAVILLLLAAILAFIAVGWRENRRPSLMFMPYAA
jgi:hypothetical protein